MATNKNGRGRKARSSGQTKSEGVLLRLEPLEKQGFADAARIAGIPLAVWMRERLRQAAILELERMGQRAAFLQDLTLE